MRVIKFRVFGSEYMSKPFTLQDIQKGKIEFATTSSVMQFTGLTDKNEKEIYEGDIVNYAVKESWCKNDKCETKHRLYLDKFCPSCGSKIEPEDFVRKAEIRFREGGFCLYREHSNDGYTITYSAWQTYIAETYIQWKEVVGNIYQNPELLKTKEKGEIT